LNEYFTWQQKTFCIGISAQLDMKKREHEYGLYWSDVNCIFMTANNWQGAIKDLKLSVIKQKPKDVVSLCFDCERKKMDSLTF
jgi:hypothetical protein